MSTITPVSKVIPMNNRKPRKKHTKEDFKRMLQNDGPLDVS